MALFSRRETTAARGPSPQAEPAARPERRQLVNKGWEEGDPRHTGHLLLSQVGLAHVWWWDRPIDDLWETLVGRAPALGALEPAGRPGFSQFRNDGSIFAFGVEGEKGSAVVVAFLPDADTDRAFTQVVLPLDGIAERGVFLDLVSRGEVEGPPADVIESGSIVQLTELPLRGSSEPTTFRVIPPSVRRGLTSWTQASHDIYRRDFTDSDGDTVSVLCWLHDGRPALVYPFFDMPSGDLTPLQPMQEHIDGEIVWIEPKAAARRVLPRGADPTAAAQQLVDSVARGLGVLSEHRRRASAEPGTTEEPAPVPKALTSWTDVLTVLRTRYKVAQEFNEDAADPSVVTGCKLIFNVGGDRVQAVIASRVDLGDDPWVRISSAFARLGAVDLQDVLQRVSRTVCGDLRLVEDLLTFNHTAPVKGLDSQALTDLVDIIVTTADQLESEFGAGDTF